MLSVLGNISLKYAPNPKILKLLACANCGEDHTANYRDINAKELQKRRNEITNNRKKTNIQSKRIVEEKQSELKEKLTEDNQAILVKKDRVTYVDN